MGRPRHPKFGQVDVRSMRAVPLLDSLGASCWLIFRSLGLTGPLLAAFAVSLSRSWHLFIDFFNIFDPPNAPGTSKINEKPLVFLGFLLFSHIAQADRKSAKNASSVTPESFQDSPNPSQDPPKTPRNCSKTSPRRLPDAL